MLHSYSLNSLSKRLSYEASDITDIKNTMSCDVYSKETAQDEDICLRKCLMKRFNQRFGCILPQLYFTDPVAAQKFEICTFK